METYKLTYFDGMGRGEVARLIFALAGQKYVDKRITFEEWSKCKATTPFGFVPILEYKGMKLSESTSIVRFLGKHFKLAGSNEIESAQADMVLQILANTFSELPFFEKDENVKKEKIEKAFSKFIIPHFGEFERMKGKKDFLVSNKMTYADVAIYYFATVFKGFRSNFMEDFPGLAKVVSAVEKNSKIAKWLKERPKTPF